MRTYVEIAREGRAKVLLLLQSETLFPAFFYVVRAGQRSTIVKY